MLDSNESNVPHNLGTSKLLTISLLYLAPFLLDRDSNLKQDRLAYSLFQMINEKLRMNKFVVAKEKRELS